MSDRGEPQDHNDQDADIRTEVTVELLADRLIARLPEAASARLPSRGQVAVRAVIDGQAVDTVIEPDGRKGHWLALDRLAPAPDPGDHIPVDLKRSPQWPEPELPGDLSAALAQATDLDEHWADITPMARWEWVRWVGATKNAGTRQRRVEVTISKLRAGSRRPCCFDLSSCTDPDVAKSGKLIIAD